MPKRTGLITGVSSGFGRELTTQLLERGDRVVGTVRRPDAVADLVAAQRRIAALEALGGLAASTDFPSD